MGSARDNRLAYEFELMTAIRSPGGLIDFQCADLKADEAHAYLAASMSAEVVKGALPNFLSPEEFVRKFPGRPPEKYLVMFRCRGLMRKEPGGEIVPANQHLLEVVFGWDFPQVPPRFVWMTPIWHPNILPPYLCAAGRAFALSTTLDQICLMVGQMIQYQNYNIKDPLNHEAAIWASQNPHRFPVDRRGLLDGKERLAPAVSFTDGQLIEFADVEPPPTADTEDSGDEMVTLL
jgi:hypothetical protein